MRNSYLWFLVAYSLSSCYGVNKETSEIGPVYHICPADSNWVKITEKYPIKKITDSIFLAGLNELQNHFLKPEYIIYFEDEPKEIVGCSGTSIRVAFSPTVAEFAVDGLSKQLSDEQQVRIRNRVLNVLLQYECPEGKEKIKTYMTAPAVYSKEY